MQQVQTMTIEQAQTHYNVARKVWFSAKLRLESQPMNHAYRQQFRWAVTDLEDKRQALEVLKTK